MSACSGHRAGCNAAAQLMPEPIALSARFRGIDKTLMLQVAIPNPSESLDVEHEGRTDVDLAVLTDENRLAVIASVIHLDTDEMPFAGYDLKHKLWIAHRAAVLLAVVGHGYQLAATSPGAFPSVV